MGIVFGQSWYSWLETTLGSMVVVVVVNASEKRTDISSLLSLSLCDELFDPRFEYRRRGKKNSCIFYVVNDTLLKLYHICMYIRIYIFGINKIVSWRKGYTYSKKLYIYTLVNIKEHNYIFQILYINTYHFFIPLFFLLPYFYIYLYSFIYSFFWK